MRIRRNKLKKLHVGFGLGRTHLSNKILTRADDDSTFFLDELRDQVELNKTVCMRQAVPSCTEELSWHRFIGTNEHAPPNDRGASCTQKEHAQLATPFVLHAEGMVIYLTYRPLPTSTHRLPHTTPSRTCARVEPVPLYLYGYVDRSLYLKCHAYLRHQQDDFREFYSNISPFVQSRGLLEHYKDVVVDQMLQFCTQDSTAANSICKYATCRVRTGWA